MFCIFCHIIIQIKIEGSASKVEILSFPPPSVTGEVGTQGRTSSCVPSLKRVKTWERDRSSSPAVAVSFFAVVAMSSNNAWIGSSFYGSVVVQANPYVLPIRSILDLS
jgi:hypothetical protein